MGCPPKPLARRMGRRAWKTGCFHARHPQGSDSRALDQRASAFRRLSARPAARQAPSTQTITANHETPAMIVRSNTLSESFPSRTTAGFAGQARRPPAAARPPEACLALPPCAPVKRSDVRARTRARTRVRRNYAFCELAGAESSPRERSGAPSPPSGSGASRPSRLLYAQREADGEPQARRCVSHRAGRAARGTQGSGRALPGTKRWARFSCPPDAPAASWRLGKVCDGSMGWRRLRQEQH